MKEEGEVNAHSTPNRIIKRRGCTSRPIAELHVSHVWYNPLCDRSRRYRALAILSCLMKRDEGLDLAKRLKALLLERGYPVERVLLYGSVAKGVSKPDSDIDIERII